MMTMSGFRVWFFGILLLHVLQGRATCFVLEHPHRHRPASTNIVQQPTTKRQQPIGTTTTICNGMWSQDGDLVGTDRIKACIPYILPVLDVDHFGQYIYERSEILENVHYVLLGPLINIDDKFPFLPLLLFLGFTLGTRGNTEISR